MIYLGASTTVRSLVLPVVGRIELGKSVSLRFSNKTTCNGRTLFGRTRQIYIFAGLNFAAINGPPYPFCSKNVKIRSDQWPIWAAYKHLLPSNTTEIYITNAAPIQGQLGFIYINNHCNVSTSKGLLQANTITKQMQPILCYMFHMRPILCFMFHMQPILCYMFHTRTILYVCSDYFTVVLSLSAVTGSSGLIVAGGKKVSGES